MTADMIVSFSTGSTGGGFGGTGVGIKIPEVGEERESADSVADFDEESGDAVSVAFER